MAVDVKAGDRVRVVLEGVAVRGEGPDESFMVGSYEPNIIFPGADHVVSVDVLAPDEPANKSVVLDRGGDAWQRDDEHASYQDTEGNWFIPQAPISVLYGGTVARSWEDLNSMFGPLKVIHEAE